MKKILTYSIILLFTLTLFACGPKQTLRVLMPTEYIDESLVRDFEREYGVRVALIPFDSNEIAITQIQSNSYDLVIPSDYAVEELVDKDLLLEIDYSKFQEFSRSDFDDGLELVLNRLKDEGFDLLKYGVPYFWGNLGILYDTNKVPLSFLEANGWQALLNQNYNIMLYDSSRDMFMIALKALYGENIDINNPSDIELAAAEQWLKDAAGANADFLTDEVFDVMLKPAQYDMAVVYSGDGVYLMYENEDLGYFVPSEGTNVWVDAFAIPKNANEVDLAYLFIDYFLSYDVALDNALEIGYTSPRADVIEYIVENEEYDPAAYLIVLNATDQFFRYDTALKARIEQAWIRVRAS